MIYKTTVAALIATLTLGLAACHEKGPGEKVGEQVDETVRTIKNGGEKTTGDKVSDAVDDAKEGAKDAADDLKKD